MNSIKVIASLLNASDQKAFIAYLQNRNKRSDTKNVQLYRAIIKGETSALKNSMTANAYNVLKKRLTDRIIDFTGICILESEQTAEVEIMKRLVMSQKLLQLKHYKTGFSQLKKTELKARAIGHYHYLNEIYQTYIQYSYHSLSPDQTELFKDFKKNQDSYLNQANLNMVYALVRKSFQSAGLTKETINLNDLIENSFEQFGISESDGFTFQSLSQIAEICDISGTHKRNYFEIDLFFEHHIEKLQSDESNTEKNLPDHLKLLYLVAHIYFRKKDFNKSLSYLDKLESEMNRFQEKYRSLYELRAITLNALNQNFLGYHIAAANKLDTKIQLKRTVNMEEPGVLQALLTRIVIHFQQSEFSQAKEKLALLWHQDSWYLNTVGQEWLLNKKFIEILLEIELGNTDYTDALIKSLLRKQDLYFKDSNALALSFLRLVADYHHNPSQIKTEIFAQKVASTFEWKPTEEEDLFFMSYYAWLKSKMTGEPVYDITLSFLA